MLKKDKTIFQQKAPRLLCRIRRRINAGWCQHSEARNAEGNPTFLEWDDAKSFSLLGAIRLELNRDSSMRYLITTFIMFRITDGEKDLRIYNDAFERTKEDVLALIDKAMAILMSK